MSENEVTVALIAGGIGACYLLMLGLVHVAGRRDAEALNAFEREHGQEADDDDDIDWDVNRRSA